MSNADRKGQTKITKRILIITAEEDISLALRFALEYDTTTNSRAFKVDSFTNPLLALKKYKPGSYDLLILDIIFPKTKK